jgi:hypothetical protein
MGAKTVFSRLCGSCCDTSADPPHGALTRQHLASCAGTGMGGPSRPRGPFSTPGSTCPGEPPAQDAQGGRGPGAVSQQRWLLVSGSQHRQHFGCDGRWLRVAWHGLCVDPTPASAQAPTPCQPRMSSGPRPPPCCQPRGPGLSILGSRSHAGTQVRSCRSECHQGHAAVSWTINDSLILF